MAIIELEDADFNRQIRAAKMAVVDFHTGEHADCIVIKPIFARLSQEFPQVSFFLVDAFNAPTTTQTVFLEPMPHFAIYRDGEQLDKLSTREERALRELLTSHFGPMP